MRLPAGERWPLLHAWAEHHRAVIEAQYAVADAATADWNRAHHALQLITLKSLASTIGLAAP